MARERCYVALFLARRIVYPEAGEVVACHVCSDRDDALARTADFAGRTVVVAVYEAFGIEARIVGRVEEAPANRLTIKSEKGVFEY